MPKNSGTLPAAARRCTPISGRKTSFTSAPSLSPENKSSCSSSAPSGAFKQTQSFVHYAHEASLARDQIAKLTAAKSEFLARMSHEIRTPMNALLGMAELLSETPLNDEQREYVRVFRRAGDNLLNVINDILDFSKVEAGQIELESIEFDLAEVLADALEIAGVRARAKGLAAQQPDSAQRACALHRRSRPPPANTLEPARQCHEIHRAGRSQRGCGNGLGSRHVLHFAVSDTGIGIPADRLSTHLRQFLASRRFHHAQIRRHRPGSRDLQALR